MRISGFTPFWYVGLIASVGVAAAIWCTGSAGVSPPPHPTRPWLLSFANTARSATAKRNRSAGLRLDRMEADFTKPDTVEQWQSIQDAPPGR